MKHTPILVVRPGAIGDVLLTLPVLQALREAYVNPHITLVSNAVVLPLALASGIVDEVFDYQDIRWSELFSDSGIHSPAVRDLLAQTNLAICWLRDPDHIVEQNLREAGVKRLIVAPGRPPEGTRVHIVEYLAATVGHSPHPHSPPLLPAEHPTPGKTVPANLHQIALHPGSGGAAKCWPTENFVEVIERLWQQNLPVLLLAGPADDERLESILGQLSPTPKPELLQVLANKPLLEIAHYLQACRCYLGNDAGITHLAAMLGVPTVAIFGPSDPVVWRPIGPIVKVIWERVLERLSADVVIDAINTFI